MEPFYVANIPDNDSLMTASFLQHLRMSYGHFPLNTVDWENGGNFKNQ